MIAEFHCKSGDWIRNEPGENLWARTETPLGEEAVQLGEPVLSKELVRHVFSVEYTPHEAHGSVQPLSFF